MHGSAFKSLRAYSILYLCVLMHTVGLQTNFKLLTAAVALLVTSIQTIVISVTLPQGSYAAMILALELINFTSLWL